MALHGIFATLYQTKSITNSLAPSTFFYTLSVPLVLGTSPSRPATRLVACLVATASALKALSALWWSLSPRRQSTCTVMRAAPAKLWMQWGIISVLRSPIFSRFRPRSTTAKGRFDRSTTARLRASSRGQYAYPKRARPVGVPRALAKA